MDDAHRPRPAGHLLRVAAVVACAVPIGWAVSRPLIVGYLSPGQRSLGIVLIGLPALMICGGLWLLGGTAFLLNLRRARVRDAALVLLPVLLGILTVGYLKFAPVPLRVPFGREAAALAYADDPAAWDEAAAAVRATLPKKDWPADWGRRVAGLTVDEAAHGDDGGVWLRTDRRRDMIDEWSFGLCHLPPGTPVPTDSPFGAAHLVVKPIGGGWHTFRANDDW